MCGTDASDRYAGLAPYVGIASNGVVVERVDERALPIGERVGGQADVALRLGGDHCGFRCRIRGGLAGFDGGERKFNPMTPDEREAFASRCCRQPATERLGIPDCCGALEEPEPRV